MLVNIIFRNRLCQKLHSAPLKIPSTWYFKYVNFLYFQNLEFSFFQYSFISEIIKKKIIQWP